MIINGIESISGQITGAIDIPEPIAVIFVAIVTFGIIGLIMFFCGKFIVNVYQKYCYDEISLLVALVSVVVLIWFAELAPKYSAYVYIKSYWIWHSLVYQGI